MSKEEDPEVIKITRCDNWKFQKAELMWKIMDFEKKLAYSKGAGDKYLMSDNFKVSIPAGLDYKDEFNFILVLYWNHEIKDKKGKSPGKDDEMPKKEDKDDSKDDQCKSIGVFLKFLPKLSSSLQVTLKFSISAKLNNGRPWGWHPSEPHKFFAQEGSIWGWNDIFEKERMIKTKELFDEEGTFTVICDIEILCSRQEKSKNKAPLYQPFCLSEELYMATETKDITLLCNYDKSSEENNQAMKEDGILCHKFILTTRSDVFKAMFNHDTAENQTSTITIEDTPKNALQEFVDYLYTDKSESLKSDDIEDVASMFKLADKYNVVSLKQRCEMRLIELIKGSTVENIYALAYLHNCEPVVKAVALFVASNFDEAFEHGWMANFTQDMQNKIMKDVWNQKLKISTK